MGQGNDPKADLSQDLSRSRQWGGITARDRQAVEETANEKEIGKYLSLIDDYYRVLAEKRQK